MAANPPLTGWSPDANWFWDGLKWNDAVSADGQWRFDGTRWQPFSGQRSSMPPQPLEPPPSSPAAQSGLPSWVAASEVDKMRREQEERERAPAPDAGPPPPRELDWWSVHQVIRKVLLWTGMGLGTGLVLLGAVGLASSTLDPKNVPFVVFTMVLGSALSISCLGGLLRLQIFSTTLGAAGVAVRSLGILGSLVVLGMSLNTCLSLSRPLGGGRYVVPWATLLVVGLRVYRGRWLAAVIIGLVWGGCVMITLAAGR